MKRALIFLLLLASIASYAQTGIVKGRIIDAKTFQPLPFATVYLNQTTYGSRTNDEGDFTIPNIPAGNYELIVTYLGYQPYQSRVAITDNNPLSMSIKLITSSTNLNEVLVKAKKDSQWNTLFDKFKKQFFGVSPYAYTCKILNPWALEFSEDAKGILTAKANLPLEIENPGLGYTITCTLKEFQTGPNLYKIAGTYQFTEAATFDSTLNALWNSRREEVYRGSPTHLFKAIVDDRVAQEGFELYADISGNPEVIRNSSFLTNLNVSLKSLAVEHHQTSINLPKRTEVHYLNRAAPAKIYRNIPHPISWIETNAPLEVNQQGIVMNPNHLTVLGAMSEARIAEVLPLNYEPSKQKDQKPASKKTYSSLAALVEKPYVVTDKPYYYPSEAILFKAFFNYISPVYRDSLSHVMRIELIDASEKIVASKLFPVIAGSSSGDFMISNSIKPGDYTLCAYTRWMLNFDDQVIFRKPIKVLSLNQLAKPTTITPQSKQLVIRTEKDEFNTREKITIALEATNFYGNPVAADMVVSVTDVDQAVVPYNYKNILSEFPFTKDMLPDTSLKKPQYLIQYGIDFSGQMISGKKNKRSSGVMTIYQDNVNDVFAFATDESGRFHQQLQIMDSVDLLVASKTSNGRKARVVIDEIKEPRPSIKSETPLQLDLYKPTDPSKYHQIDSYSTAKMLEQVTIEARKIERVSADKKHLLTDSHLEGDFLKATNATDLLSALLGRVPGLLIRYAVDLQSGIPKKLIGFPAMTREVFEECMVEIDGVVVTPIGGETLAERLASMSVNEIESVDVLRFASASAYGVRAANGVIAIKTRIGNSSTDSKPRVDRSKLQVISLGGYSEANEFESPDYSEHTNGDDRTDYRSTIYWNPHSVSNGKEPLMLSFYAADIPTQYRVVVEGVTAEGEPVRAEKIIVVTNKK